MRVKLNQCYEDTLSLVSGKGYIEKFLKQEVDFLLASSVGELNGVEFDDVYSTGLSYRRIFHNPAFCCV